MVVWEYTTMINSAQEKVTAAASYTASAGAAALGIWTLNDIALAVGIFLGIATFVVNWVYKHKHVKLMKQYNDHKKEDDIDNCN